MKFIITINLSWKKESEKYGTSQEFYREIELDFFPQIGMGMFFQSKHCNDGGPDLTVLAVDWWEEYGLIITAKESFNEVNDDDDAGIKDAFEWMKGAGFSMGSYFESRETLPAGTE